ncbi:type IV pilus modification protein PilV [Lysobacter capsici]|uniref:type IV pilus modification protein PilV n=1 Tax=Lysobacter capsici TaxID=435897 RepID=UPI0006876AFB|nr:type IV pilus modification protein PilV [Lysobacter capsici]
MRTRESKRNGSTKPAVARSSRRRQTGVGLVEILVAVLVLGFGLLGVAAMQSLALRNSQSSMQRSQAVVQAYAIVDSMRANAAEAKKGAYNMAAPRCANGVIPKPDSTATLAVADQAAWMQGLAASLGARDSTCGQVTCDSAGLCTVSVRWDDTRGGTAGGESNADKLTYTLQVRL